MKDAPPKFEKRLSWSVPDLCEAAVDLEISELVAKDAEVGVSHAAEVDSTAADFTFIKQRLLEVFPHLNETEAVFIPPVFTPLLGVSTLAFIRNEVEEVVRRLACAATSFDSEVLVTSEDLTK